MQEDGQEEILKALSNRVRGEIINILLQSKESLGLSFICAKLEHAGFKMRPSSIVKHLKGLQKIGMLTKERGLKKGRWKAVSKARTTQIIKNTEEIESLSRVSKMYKDAEGLASQLIYLNQFEKAKLRALLETLSDPQKKFWLKLDNEEKKNVIWWKKQLDFEPSDAEL